jgi:hypothetical protein
MLKCYLKVLDDLIVALKLVPPKDGDVAAAGPEDSEATTTTDNSVSNMSNVGAASDENKENISTSNDSAAPAANSDQPVICSQPRPGGAELPQPEQEQQQQQPEAMEEQPPENSAD